MILDLIFQVAQGIVLILMELNALIVTGAEGESRFKTRYLEARQMDRPIDPVGILRVKRGGEALWSKRDGATRLSSHLEAPQG